MNFSQGLLTGTMGVRRDKISITLDQETLKRLDKCAEKENRNRSNLIETVLKQYFNEEKC